MPFIFRVSVGKDFRCFTLLVQTSTAKLSVEIVPFKPLVKAPDRVVTENSVADLFFCNDFLETNRGRIFGVRKGTMPPTPQQYYGSFFERKNIEILAVSGYESGYAWQWNSGSCCYFSEYDGSGCLYLKNYQVEEMKRSSLDST